MGEHAAHGLVQVAQHADDLHETVARLQAAGVEVRTGPHVIFGHDDDTLGPAGTDEWMAFVVDSEGNLVGLVEQRARESAG